MARPSSSRLRASAQPLGIVWTTLLSLGVSGCSSQSGSGLPLWTERDSAGVRIVENRDAAGLSDGGFSLSAEPTLSIGTVADDPDYQLFQVSGGVRLPDGRIAIANGGSQEVRVYDATGTLVASHGGRGSGPGEFERPRLVGRFGGDSLIVYDGGLRRASVLHADDGFVRSFPLPEEAGGFAVGRGVFADGTQVFGGGLSFSSRDGFPEGVFQHDSRYGAVGREGRLSADYGGWPASEMFGRTREDGFTARVLPFGSGTVLAVGPDRLWMGNSERFEIRGLAPDGRLTHVVRLDRLLRAVTDADIDQYKVDELEDADTPDERRAFEMLMLEMPVPEVFPAFGVMAVDALGHLWVQDYAGPRVRRPKWTVFDPDGRLVGNVQTPDRVQILEIGDDYVLGRLSDELDVEYVQLWSLTRPTR